MFKQECTRLPLDQVTDADILNAKWEAERAQLVAQRDFVLQCLIDRDAEHQQERDRLQQELAQATETAAQLQAELAKIKAEQAPPAVKYLRSSSASKA